MGWRDWTGVGERRWKTAPNEQVQPAKTLWDWLQLLIVPAILIGVTFVWSATQTRSDNKREDRRIDADQAAAEEARRDATLQAYLDEMSGLMLDKKLLTSKESDAVRAVARTVTLTALRRLNGERKGEVVRFLQEARLIRAKGEARVSLAGANLTDANLRGAILADADLSGADLTDANLTRANLTRANLLRAYLYDADLPRADLTAIYRPHADFSDANLTRANLTGAALFDADFTYADLVRADLKSADLKDADLPYANLTRANLRGAHLIGVDVNGADLIRADLTGADLTRADLTGADLTGAKGLPKGSR